MRLTGEFDWDLAAERQGPRTKQAPDIPAPSFVERGACGTARLNSSWRLPWLSWQLRLKIPHAKSASEVEHSPSEFTTTSAEPISDGLRTGQQPWHTTGPRRTEQPRPVTPHRTYGSTPHTDHRNNTSNNSNRSSRRHMAHNHPNSHSISNLTSISHYLRHSTRETWPRLWRTWRSTAWSQPRSVLCGSRLRARGWLPARLREHTRHGLKARHFRTLNLATSHRHRQPRVLTLTQLGSVDPHHNSTCTCTTPPDTAPQRGPFPNNGLVFTRRWRRVSRRHLLSTKWTFTRSARRLPTHSLLGALLFQYPRTRFIQLRHSLLNLKDRPPLRATTIRMLPLLRSHLPQLQRRVRVTRTLLNLPKGKAKNSTRSQTQERNQLAKVQRSTPRRRPLVIASPLGRPRLLLLTARD